MRKTTTHPWLAPLPLKGGIELPHRIMLGPMDGVMTPVFCRAANDLNLTDYWITPFIRLSTAVPKSTILKKRLAPFSGNQSKQVIVQLLGSDPVMLADVAKAFQDLGVAGVNLNFGCPSNRVLQKNGGAKLLTQCDLMMEIIDSVIKACPDFSVSLKLRSGYDSPTEMEAFIPNLANLEIDFIMFHYRTAVEMYDTIRDGTARVSRAVKLAAHVPLIASGDVFSMRNALDMFESTSCAGITFARGFLKDPSCVRRLQAELKNEKIDLDIDHKTVFFNKISELANNDKFKFKKSYRLEIARLMWGRNSPEFIAEYNK
jgi:tRNA-dihydrouridine synthase C